MIEVTRINLIGKQVLWWWDVFALREIRSLRVIRTNDGWIRETGINIQAHIDHLNELRHATMLEF